MASANYANDKTDLSFSGPEGDQEDIVMERDMTPTGNIWDQTSLASDWSSHVEEEEASGAGKVSLREPELSLEEAEGFKGTTEGEVEEVADTNDGAEILQDGTDQTSGAGVVVPEGACQEPGNAQSNKEVMIKFVDKGIVFIIACFRIRWPTSCSTTS